jgi:hypothetical protein
MDLILDILNFIPKNQTPLNAQTYFMVNFYKNLGINFIYYLCFIIKNLVAATRALQRLVLI